ncbi:hypothetical protein [Paenibacillus sp. WLX2291]|uniref:hypothetical protein n=1 Tax=Paenibacillus sp. WLX2291 TaxID=3296934 RepID=UPI0039840B5B
MMKTNVTKNFTKYYMDLCYNCEEAAKCQDEETCLACWADQGLFDKEQDDTHQMLNAYYA